MNIETKFWHFKNNDEPIEVKGNKLIILSRKMIKGNSANANVKFIITNSNGTEIIPKKLEENNSNSILEVKLTSNAEIFIQQNVIAETETEFELEYIIEN